MSYERPLSGNDLMFALMGATDIAFGECCLMLGTITFAGGRGFSRLEIVGDRGVVVEYRFGEDENWDGYAYVTVKGRTDRATVEGLTDALTEATRRDS